jgi:phosphatidylinositol alpha-1,6-mannosyltransferase
MTRRLLLVTNDFPPRPGGIQSFLHGIVSRLPPEDVVVLTSRWRGWQEWDETQPYVIVRHDTSVLLPTPAVRRHALALLAEHGCSQVWFGAAAPLGLLAPALRAAGATRLVATTHGHEVGWAALPGTSAALRRVASSVDTVTYLGDYTRGRLAGAIKPYDDRLRRLAPAVDSSVFSPAARDPARREQLGLAGRPVVVAVSRLMPRKGQDMLIRALPQIRRRVDGTALLLVGGGPSRARLERLAADNGVADHVVFTGSVSHADLPSWYGVGDVFAMPVRERLGGLDVEGLGIVFLEAAACGLPLVAGRSGGSVEAVIDGETGLVVDGESVAEVADAVVSLLVDPVAAAQMGRRARAWVSEKWSWQATLRDFHAVLPAEPDEKRP